MASEPSNPYAPSPLSARDGEPENVRRPSRWLAAIASLLCMQPFAGVGLYVIGRPRRWLAWSVPSTAAYVATFAGVWLGSPTAFLLGLGAMVALGLAAFVDTLSARASASIPSLTRALVVVLLVFAGERATGYTVRAFVAEGFRVPSHSMAPSVRVGDHIMVKKGRAALERGTPVVHRYPPDRSVSYVKRIIALAGDTVEIRAGQITVNGATLPQAPTDERCPAAGDEESSTTCRVLRESSGARTYTIMLDGHPPIGDMALRIPDGHVFVLGDNRDNSRDSRVYGPVPVADIVGTVGFIYWSRTGDGAAAIDRLGRRP